MFFFSLILHKSVKLEEGRHVGRVFDMVMVPGDSFPKIIRIVFSSGGKKYRVDWNHIKHLDEEGVIIRGNKDSFPVFEPNGEVLVKRDVLDKQIVDINGHRVVRVNDIQLNLLSGTLWVAGVDVGTAGLLRRLGLLNTAEKITKTFNKKLVTRIIPWDTVQTLGTTDAPIKLSTTHRKLTSLHPADLADIIEELSGVQQSNLFHSLDKETAAEALEHLEDEVQIALFRTLSDETASDILEEMAPDEAADLLQDLPQNEAEKLLKLMEPEEAEDVRELLEYREDTPGGLMNPDFIPCSADMTCQQAIDRIREESPEAELIYYVYITDENSILKGVVSLRDIIVNDPSTKLRDIMIDDVVFVYDNENLDVLIDLVVKYDLLAVPVLDTDKELLGIITFDDVMEILKIRRG